MANPNNKAFLVAVCITLLSSAVAAHSTYQPNYNNSDVEQKFVSWMKRHNKHYKDKDEWMLRFGIYQANLELINFVNSQNLSYKLGDNKFADLTNDEFRELYVGRQHFHIHNLTEVTESKTQVNVPKAVDWRKKGAVTEVKNQRNCNCCWAFAAAAAVEGIIQIKKGTLVSLSVQELLDCSGIHNDCNSGHVDLAFKYIKDRGIAKSDDYPYKEIKEECKTGKLAKAAKIDDYKLIKKESETSLKEALAQQPVAVNVDSSGFYLYESGIYSGECGTNLDHSVLAVGYGEEGSEKYWTLKNSWGADWGEAGYIRILREGGTPQGTCGVAMHPAIPIVK